MYTQTVRQKQRAHFGSRSVRGANTSMQQGIPNSAISGLDGGGYALPDLEQRMQQRLAAERQIPSAEREADNIAASVSGARTPEEVKAQLGEKMGADFSSVRFHTDSNAVNTAEGMGARAYTSGRDVYFGQGGFDPAIAAHELVHTAQQGAVESAMSTVSAPMGGVQMKPKRKPTASDLAQQRNAKLNAQLMAMGPEALERINSGQGGFFERRKYRKLMGKLNGSAGNELSEGSLEMLYNAGAASRDFVTNRTLDNLITHIKGKHEAQHPNGYQPADAAAHGAYVADLQNQGVREGSGGALTEYGRLNTVLSRPAVATAREDLLRHKDTQHRHTSDSSFKADAAALGQQMMQGLPGHIQGAHGDNLRSYNGVFLDKLQAAMPEVFTDDELNRSFVAKSSALRGFFPMLTEHADVNEDALAIRASGASGLTTANNMLSPQGTGRMTPEARNLRDAMLPARAPAPAPAPAQTTGQKTSDETLPYRALMQDSQRLNSIDPDDMTTDVRLARLYSTIKRYEASGDVAPEELTRLKKEFVGERTAQMEAERQAAAPGEKKKKWYQFWK